MDVKPLPVSPNELCARLGTASGPVLVDVRRPDAFSSDDRLVIGAVHRPAEFVPNWLNDLPRGRPVVVYCARGHEVSQSVADTLRRVGVQAAYLEGGIAAWKEHHLRRSDVPLDKWVTREHPKIDRIACPWLVLRFVNPDAEFLYVPAADVLKAASERGAIPYDIKGVAFGYVGESCSFDAIVPHFGIYDRALDQLATIVRGADTSRPDPCAAVRRAARDLPRPVGEFSRRPRNAQAWLGDLRRALCLVPFAARQNAHLTVRGCGANTGP